MAARVAEAGRREDIMQAARTVFNEKGYNDARMAEIAERAGVAAGTVYLYFKSKEELVTALCEDYLDELHGRVIDAIVTSKGKEAVANSVHVALEFAESERDLVCLLNLRTGLGTLHEPLPADQKMLDSISDILAERMEAGEVRDGYDPRVLAEIVSGLIEWVTKACLVWGNGDIARYEGAVISLLQNAILKDTRESARIHIPLMW